MSDLIKIAVDAMGGDGSPKKIIDGIILNHSANKNNFFKIFGDKTKIDTLIKGKIPTEFFEIIHTEKKIESTDSPLEGAKRGKDTSMWLAIQSVKDKETDIVISAGNTGALLVVSKLNLKMIENIDKPALSALWPNKKGMSVVLDLGANIECSSKNLVDFSIIYKTHKRDSWSFLNGDMKDTKVIIKKYKIPENLKNKNYLEDREYRVNFKNWIEKIWDEKDQIITDLKF